MSYVLSIHDKMAKLQEIVQENLTKSQRSQRFWYNQSARMREFSPGDSVLVLPSTSANKLLAKWREPYPITRRVGEVVYEVDMKDSRGRRKRFHVNMLREWVIRREDAHMTEELDDEEGAGIFLWERNNIDPPRFNDALSSQQFKDLQGLLRQFPDVLGPEPDGTNIAEHSIQTRAAQPIRFLPYRLYYMHIGRP